MDLENILYSKHNNIAHIIVNRPEKRNALNRATRLEMLTILEDVKADPGVKVLILSGAGEKTFIAGSDLTELSTFSPLEMEKFLATLGQQLYTRFEQLEKPVIAMINGLCLGAGLELALASDIRIASDNAKFGQPEILLGIMPGGGGTQRLSRLIGIGKAKEIILTGNVIHSEEAYRIGLVNQISPFEKLEDTVMLMARHIAEQSSLALKWAKRSINMSHETNLTVGLAFEALTECLLFSSKDKEEGMRAFFEKRKPQFKEK